MTIISANKNDIGRNQERQNVDYIWVDDQVGLYIVADGMGGHEAGDVASKLAATIIAEFITTQLANQDHPPSSAMIQKIMIDAAETANTKVYQAAQNAKQKRKMGTTVVMALIKSNTAYISHAGDSRAYLLRQSTLTQLTEDDSWEVFSGKSSNPKEASAILDPVLTKAIGQNSSLNPSFITIDVSPGDVIILCSDGLWNMVEADRILAEVEKAGDRIDQAVEALVAAANEAGGKDNISVVLIRSSSL